MIAPQRGEVWLVDLGLAAKIRPCLVISVPPTEADRKLITLVPHTTARRGSNYEVSIPVRFLKPGAFDAQGLVTVPPVYLIQKLGALTISQMSLIDLAVCRWLGIDSKQGEK